MQGVVTIEEEGVFVVHSVGISVLATGSKSWTAGPLFVSHAVCACNISSKSFVTIHFDDKDNVHQYSATPQNGVKLEPAEIWPSLLTKRHAPGCGTTSYNFIVAGGVSDWDEVLSSVEVFHIATKSLRRGGDMRQARAFFKIVPVGTPYPRLLAIGGRDKTSTLSTTEWWEEEENSWMEGQHVNLSTERSSFAALLAPERLVCSQADPVAHFCLLQGSSVAPEKEPELPGGSKFAQKIHQFMI